HLGSRWVVEEPAPPRSSANKEPCMLRLALLPTCLATVLAAAAAATPALAHGHGRSALGKIDHIVVIYEENHSFDNLYGRWEGVRGLDAATASNTKQVRQDGTQYACLMQNDVNLASPPLPADCTDTSFSSHFTNNPFTIDDF